MVNLRVCARLASALVGLSLAGCGSETAILIEVSARDLPPEAQIATLHFLVGVRRTEAPAAGFFVEDPESSIEIDVAGRDLADHPYRLLVRDATGGADPAEIAVAVGAVTDGNVVASAVTRPPQAFVPGRVILRGLPLVPGLAFEVKGTGCVRWSAEGAIGVATDLDCDGDPTTGVEVPDCADDDPKVGPSQPEDCFDDIDNNCVENDEFTDDDADGYTECDGDCRDDVFEIHPGAEETCDGIDNDCSGTCDDAELLDPDGDGFSACGTVPGACEPPAAEKEDCKPDLGSAYPGAPELCNGHDDDCDGACDEELDGDGDGLTPCGSIGDGTCGQVGPADCDDTDPEVRPGAPEACNGKDDDCDGLPAPPVPCYTTDATLGGCLEGSLACSENPATGEWTTGDCVSVSPRTLLPEAICEAYGACVAAATPKPWQCALNEAIDGFWDCDLAYLGGSSPVLCPEASALLPAAPEAATDCVWRVVGNLIRPHYKVGLDGGGVIGGDAILSCEGWFTVTEATGSPPPPDELYLTLGYADAAGTRAAWVLRTSITPVEVVTCGGVSALSCVLHTTP